MRALIVMDMQDNLLGDYKKDELLKNINTEINRFDKNNVYYIKTIKRVNFLNRLVKKDKKEADIKLSDKLSVVNGEVISKDRNNIFSKKDFEKTLKDNKIDELQIVGIDACSSVFKSVISALKCGFKVVVNKNLVGAKSEEKADKLYKKMGQKGAKILN